MYSQDQVNEYWFSRFPTAKTLNDAKVQYLKSIGFVGTINDMERDFYNTLYGVEMSLTEGRLRHLVELKDDNPDSGGDGGLLLGLLSTIFKGGT